MNNLLKAELYKLWHKWSFWGMTLFALVLGSVLLFDSSYMVSGIQKASLYNTPLLYFLIIIFAVFFIGEDFENRTLHCFITSGHKRSTVLLAKTISYLIASELMLMIPLVLHGFMGVVILGDSTPALPVILLNIAVVFIAILAMGMLPLLSAFVFKDIAKTLAVPMILYFLMIFGLNGDHANQVAVVLPMGQLRLLSLNELPVTKIAIIGIDILWIALLYFGAYISFCRSDLK